jgi:hypothetical protein
LARKQEILCRSHYFPNHEASSTPNQTKPKRECNALLSLFLQPQVLLGFGLENVMLCYGWWWWMNGTVWLEYKMRSKVKQWGYGSCLRVFAYKSPVKSSNPQNHTTAQHSQQLGLGMSLYEMI